MNYQTSLIIDQEIYAILPPVYRGFVDFYQAWVQAGCQPNWMGAPCVGSSFRFLVDSEATGRPKIVYQSRDYRAYNQEATWGQIQPFGGLERHPSEAFAELVRVWRSAVSTKGVRN